jgi:hypothetical protein
MKRLFSRERWRGHRPKPIAGGKGEPADEVAVDFTPEELQEFLDADELEVRADPVFKERLREKLWSMVRTRAASRVGGDRPS